MKLEKRKIKADLNLIISMISKKECLKLKRIFKETQKQKN